MEGSSPGRLFVLHGWLLEGILVESRLSGTQIFFAPDSSGQSGGLTLSGVEESFDDTWTATTYTVEIIADANLSG